MKFDQIHIPPSTDRLEFRKLSEDDFDDWLKFILSEKAMVYFDGERTEAYCKQWIERQLSRYKEGSGGLLAVLDKKSGKFLGQAGLLVRLIEDDNMLEVGYSFLPEFWGKGYATEAAKALFDYAFNNQLAPFVVSLIDVKNAPSEKVARRNGLKIWKQTKFQGHLVNVWRMDAEDWG